MFQDGKDSSRWYHETLPWDKTGLICWLYPQRARMTAEALGIIFSHNSVDAEKKY